MSKVTQILSTLVVAISLVPISGSLASAQSTTNFQLQNIVTQKCIDLTNVDPNNHVKIQQYDCRSKGDTLRRAQVWDFRPMNGAYQIRSVASGKCLDVPNLKKDNGLQIQQYSCRGSRDKLVKAQLWRVYNLNGRKQFQSVASGKCLDVRNVSRDSGAAIQQYSCRRSNDRLVGAQLWNLTSIFQG